VEGDILLRVLGLEEEQLGDDKVGNGVVDRPPDEDDPLFEQARVDVVRPLTPVGLLNDHRHESAHSVSSFPRVYAPSRVAECEGASGEQSRLSAGPPRAAALALAAYSAAVSSAALSSP